MSHQYVSGHLLIFKSSNMSLSNIRQKKKKVKYWMINQQSDENPRITIPE